MGKEIEGFAFDYMHDSWKEFMTSDRIEKLNDIYEKIKDIEFNPKKENVLRFLKLDISELKVVLLGQDPYPHENDLVATGRAFEVGTLESWNETFNNGSLKNIVCLLYKSYFNEIKTYSQIKTLIEKDEFQILPPNKLFSHWEREGVLLLNRYLTCKKGEPGSHQSLWKEFGIELAKYINNKNDDVIWFLWGNDAKGLDDFVGFKNKISSCHPSPMAQRGAIKFIDNDCFIKTKGIISWLN